MKCPECGSEMRSRNVKKHIRDPDSYGCKVKHLVVGRRYTCHSCGAEGYEEVRDKYGKEIEGDNKVIMEAKDTCNNGNRYTPVSDTYLLPDVSYLENFSIPEELNSLIENKTIVFKVELDMLRVIGGTICAHDIESDIRRKEDQLEEMKRELEEYIDELTGAQQLDAEIGTMQDEIKGWQDSIEDPPAPTSSLETHGKRRIVRIEAANKILLERIRGNENDILNNQKEIDRHTSNIPDYGVGETLEDHAKRKRLGPDDIRLKIEGLKDGWENYIFEVVDHLNENIYNVYRDMGFTTFRDIKITKELTRGRLTSLDAVVEHASGKKMCIQCLPIGDQLIIAVIILRIMKGLATT